MTAPPTWHPAHGWHPGPGVPHLSRPQQLRREVGTPIGALVAMGVVLGLILLLLGVIEPVGFLLGFTATTVAMAVVVGTLLWLDRWEPEPPRLLLLAFLWGGTVAVVVSVVLGIPFTLVLGDLSSVVGAPLVEEAAKGAFLLLMLTGHRRRELDGVVDGLVYAGFVAVGFAFVEDVLYIVTAFAEDPSRGIGTAVLRLGLGPFAHPLFTACTGIGVGLWVARPRDPNRWLYPVLGYAGAVALHALWNGSTLFGTAGYLTVYAVVMVPVFGGAVALAVVARRRERDVVHRQLPALVHHGWVSPAEAGGLASLSGRRGWRRGVPADRRTAVRAFHAAATELCFLRDRVDRGVGPADAGPHHVDLVLELGRARAAAAGVLTGPPLGPRPDLPPSARLPQHW